ncbi:MAG: penicillin-binding protein activator LpoB [Kiritimatiellia bacterium]|nr:penicillin-binding protein activator LpoB [Kiritimatiellia bacterium]
MKRMWTGLAVLALVAMMTGCINTMEYGDATSTKPISTEFGSADLQRIAAKMVDSLLGDDLLMDDIGTAGPPLLIVDKVKNKTSQHIDTESVTDSIRTKLIRSRMFSFQDRTTEAALAEELAYQQTAAQDAVAMGQQDAPRYMLTANLSEISQKAGRVRDVYYKFTMSLRDLKSGRLLWADEEEIRKVKTRAIIGG